MERSETVATPKKPTVVQLESYSVTYDLFDGARVSTTQQGMFSSLAKAKRFLKKHIASDTLRYLHVSREAFLYFVAKIVPLDEPQQPTRTLVLARDGTLHGEVPDLDADAPWGGRPPDKRKFRDGEIVHYCDGSNYRVGVVLGGPVTPEEAKRWGGVTKMDDLYLVGNVDRYHPTDDYQFDHDHMPEATLWADPPKLSKRMRKALELRWQRYVKANPKPGET